MSRFFFFTLVTGVGAVLHSPHPKKEKVTKRSNHKGKDQLFTVEVEQNPEFAHDHELLKIYQDANFTGSYVIGMEDGPVFAPVRASTKEGMGTVWKVNDTIVPKYVISLSRDNPRFAKFVQNVEHAELSFKNTCRVQAVHGEQCNNFPHCGRCNRPAIEGAIGMSHMKIWSAWYVACESK
eukprot:gene346-881_t